MRAPSCKTWSLEPSCGSVTTAAAPATSLTSSSLGPVLCTAGIVLVALVVTATHRSKGQEDGAKPPLKPRKIHSLDGKIPIIGDLLLFMRNAHRKHDFFTELMLRYRGEPWQGNIVGMPTFVNFTDPRAIEEITSTQFDNFEKGAFQSELVGDLLGNGIVVSDGERWYHQRKTAVKFFSARALRECMLHNMQRNMSLMYKAIDASESADELFDLSQLFSQFTLQTFGEAGLGVDIPLIGKKEQQPFERALDTAVSSVLRRATFPPIVWKLERWLGIGQEKVLADSMKIVHSWLQEMIERSLAGIRSKRDDDRHGQSIVELFVQYGDDDTAGLKPEDLSDFILNFVFAARDTSANTLSWLFYSLGKHPEVVASIRREMDERIAPGAEFLTAEDVKRLTYLEATIRETLRLYPGAPSTVRQVVRDTVICGDIFLRKGTMIGMNTWAQARNPLVWGENAADFNPQRWIDAATGGLVQEPAYKFFAFSAGPRSCVGMKLAMLNLRVVAANLLHRYAFEIDPANDGTYLNAPTLAMKHPLRAKATHRRV